MAKKRSIMFVSPGGTRVKTMRVPLWAAFTIVIMTAAGIAGFFVPFDKLILTEQELTQKKGLEEQNARLQNNIGTTLKMLSDLKERTERLEKRKEQGKDIIGLPQQQTLAVPPATDRQKAPAPAALSSAAVLRHISESEKLVAKFASSVNEGTHNVFDTIPVIRPVPQETYVVSRHYGMDRDPFTGKQKMHYGVDFAATVGTPVTATATGTIVSVENDPIWGRRVTIAHGRGFRTVYAHLGTVRATQGKTVKRGEEIGTIGMSGLTTGPHVHYEIWLKERQVNPKDYFFPDILYYENTMLIR